MAKTPLPDESTGTSITIKEDQLVIQDHQAHKASFPAVEAPQVVGGIIKAILDDPKADGGPTDATSAAFAEDLVKDAATALAIALEHKDKRR